MRYFSISQGERRSAGAYRRPAPPPAERPPPPLLPPPEGLPPPKPPEGRPPPEGLSPPKPPNPPGPCGGLGGGGPRNPGPPNPPIGGGGGGGLCENPTGPRYPPRYRRLGRKSNRKTIKISKMISTVRQILCRKKRHTLWMKDGLFSFGEVTGEF